MGNPVRDITLSDYKTPEADESQLETFVTKMFARCVGTLEFEAHVANVTSLLKQERITTSSFVLIRGWSESLRIVGSAPDIATAPWRMLIEHALTSTTPIGVSSTGELKANWNQNDLIVSVAQPFSISEGSSGLLLGELELPFTHGKSATWRMVRIASEMLAYGAQIERMVQQRTESLVNNFEELKLHCDPEAKVYGILGRSPALRTAVTKGLRASQSDATVLMVGESGSGKERFARMIHLSGDKRDGPFVCVNCAAIPQELLESELFGHEKGSFTGATSARIGKFELANNGTLFLDEIGDMNQDLQAKLLRALQERTIQRVGAAEEVKIDVRIIAATNCNLEEDVRTGKFRLDLYFRLNVLRINLPPLRDRQGDIKLLANYFITRDSQRYARNVVFSKTAMDRLESYSWPGNIRQLENVVERAVILMDHEIVTAEDIDMLLTEELASAIVGERAVHGRAVEVKSDEIGESEFRPYRRVQGDEMKRINQAIESANGNKTLAAKFLGLTPRQLHYRLSKLGLRSDNSVEH